MFTSFLGRNDARQLTYKLLFILYALFLLLLSACKSAELFLPQIHALQAWLGGDKLMHCKLAIFLSFFAISAYAPKASKRRGVSLLIVIALLACGLLLDEFHQLLLGSRRFDLIDTVYGLLGVGLGLILRFFVDASVSALKHFVFRKKTEK